MDGRGRLAEPVTDGAHARPAAGAAPVARRARAARARDRRSSRARARLAPLVGAVPELAAAARRRRRGGGRVRARERRLRRRARRASARDRRRAARSARRRRQCARLPHHLDRARRPAPAHARGNSRHRRRHRPHVAAVPRCRRRRARGSRPIPGSPRPRCSSSIPAGCTSRSTEREAFALWQKDGKVSVIADDGTVLEPYVAAALRQPAAGRGRRRRDARRRISSRCSTAIRLLRDAAARLDPGRRAALEPQAQERHRRAAAGNRRRARARHAGRSSIATRSCCRATSSRSICACRTA